MFSYLRQFLAVVGRHRASRSFPDWAARVEIGGEELPRALIPYNVNSQSIRQRFWDGQDKQIRDDLTMLKGNHLFGFGGAYQRNFDYHSRSDNGAGVNNQISYRVDKCRIQLDVAKRAVHPQRGSLVPVFQL